MSADKKAEMRVKFNADPYESPETKPGALARATPSLYFYTRLAAGPVRWLFRKAARGQCDDESWVRASAWVADILEATGCKFCVEGLENPRKIGAPCVYVANHQSTLETFVMPGLLRPLAPVTFVVKESLVRLPLFGPVMRSRDPVAVGRSNPREDLKAILEGGCERLRKGISIVIFPQATRSTDFDRKKFNSVGVKLAAKAGVPLVPTALKTDAWGNGKKIRELGKINPRSTIRFKFGPPVSVSGTGKSAHSECCDFIENTLSAWRKKDGSPS